ncbi:MAG: recombinase family protein [Clostridia bacterium]|nr:recombinase family protein [Clostridia bacterium]
MMTGQTVIKQRQNHYYGGEEETALYCRLSRDDDQVGDSDSIVHQKEILLHYAKEQGLKNPQYYVDDGFSGSNFERPDFKRMMEGVESGKITTVVVKDMSRFGRDHIMVGYYTQYVLPENEVRFIAVNDGVDSFSGKEDDITPFRNILNEMYAKDCSRKIRSVLTAKGKSGKHLTVAPVFGYRKDPTDKTKWIIDEEAANIVKRIFQLALEGNGPYKIAEILTQDNVETPFLYGIRKGLPMRNKRCKYPEIWTATSIRQMLGYEEYLGKTVNFKTQSKSYKSRKRRNNVKENWLVFENTQEPIIDETTFNAVQKVLASRHTDRVYFENNMFTGLLYCMDCGNKMTIKRLAKDRTKDHFTCSSYIKKTRSTCSRHKIFVKTLERLVLDDINRVCERIICHEREFTESYLNKSAKSYARETSALKRELEEKIARAKEIDEIIRKLYEDNVKGKITDERYGTMSAAYEEEQKTVKGRIKELNGRLNSAREETENLNKFITVMRQYTELTELTPELLHSLVDRIYIGEKYRLKDKTVQEVKIVYNFVGCLV